MTVTSLKIVSVSPMDIIVPGIFGAATITYIAGAITTKWNEAIAPRRVRLLCGAGLLVACGMVFLGGIWPSLFTIVAILVLPALFVFAVGFVRTRWFAGSPMLRVYSFASVIVSALCWVVEFVWLLRS